MDTLTAMVAEKYAKNPKAISKRELPQFFCYLPSEFFRIVGDDLHFFAFQYYRYQIFKQGCSSVQQKKI